jgi:hypothetical protein
MELLIHSYVYCILIRPFTNKFTHVFSICLHPSNNLVQFYGEFSEDVLRFAVIYHRVPFLQYKQYVHIFEEKFSLLPCLIVITIIHLQFFIFLNYQCARLAAIVFLCSYRRCIKYLFRVEFTFRQENISKQIHLKCLEL